MRILKTIIIVLVMIVSINAQTIKKTVSSEMVGFSSYSATAYCLSKNKTATGKAVRYGYIAVDPRLIKLGSKVEIFGLGIFTAEDIGGGIRGRRIDIWMPCSKTKQWGKRNIFIKVL